MTGTEHDEIFRPYVPNVVIDWLRKSPDASSRIVDGTLAFIDISGFTRLTERFAQAGKVGAEEVSQILNAAFASLLDVAFEYGADLIKWGGDAVLLLFLDEGHAAAACAATWGMRRTLRRVGKVTGTAGSAKLRMSAGLHSGQVNFFLVGSRHRELIITGPAATGTAVMEAAAEAGEVAISPETAALLGPGLAQAESRARGTCWPPPLTCRRIRSAASATSPDLTLDATCLLRWRRTCWPASTEASTVGYRSRSWSSPAPIGCWRPTGPTRLPPPCSTSWPPPRTRRRLTA